MLVSSSRLAGSHLTKEFLVFGRRNIRSRTNSDTHNDAGGGIVAQNGSKSGAQTNANCDTECHSARSGVWQQ